MSKAERKVYIGLSGGVDSAVSAALLKEGGYDVTGVFIKIWSPEFLECTWREDRLDAMRVAVALGIPFKEIDLSDEYRTLVVANMIEEYTKGRTPNPDVLCNETIKFGAFLRYALAEGADYIATGHYARIEANDNPVKLLKGIDPAKDQSYFLYRLTEDNLKHALFPVGGFTKPEIRDKARKFGLPNAGRPDSQGLCFVGDVSIHEFLGRFIALHTGELHNQENAVIGEHDGAALYTIGQRHGFRLRSDAPEGPYYVTDIDTKKNIVRVSKVRSETLHTKATLIDMHWIQAPHKAVEAAPRYHAKPVRASIENNVASFETPVQLTPGQSLVFYSGEECLGGALIHSVG